MALLIEAPKPGEYAPYYDTYIRHVASNDLLKYFNEQTESVISVCSSLSEEQLLYRYAPGKWSVKDVIGHIIDAERIFSYRALTFARGDKTELPGFEENEYAAVAKMDARSKQSLLDDYRAVRQSTIALFSNLDPSTYMITGTANKNPMSVRAIGYIIAGHELHHLSVVKERYLK